MLREHYNVLQLQFKEDGRPGANIYRGLSTSKAAPPQPKRSLPHLLLIYLVWRETGIGPDDMIPDGISFDIANPKYRQFKSGDNILEYTLEGGEITIDWVSGKGASTMMTSILDADGASVSMISGYVTDKLGDASNLALQRLGDRMARQLGGDWTAIIEVRGDRRFVIFTK